MKTKKNYLYKKNQQAIKKNSYKMKTNNNIYAASKCLILLFALVLILITSCQKDENDVDLRPAPELPPLSSMIMNFADFTDIDTTDYKNTTTFKNWGWSALNVGIWNVVITVNLVVPVAAFYESFNHEGIYDPTVNAWVWSYNFFVAGIIHQAKLQGSLVADGVHWEMYISKNNVYDNFLWYEGTTSLNNTTAEWHFNEKPTNPSEWVLIEYSNNTQSGIEEIKYSNVSEGSPGNGGYIEYGSNTNLDFDAFYNIYIIEQDHLINIEWSSTLKDGHVRDETHFGDFGWKCWYTDLTDIICP